jgi:aminocarboxymuconate-semialdehyde decarboxylase
MRTETKKKTKMATKASSLKKHGAIDSHTHIVPLGFIEDVRRGRFGSTVTIEQGKGSEWIIGRGASPELRIKLTPLWYESEERFKDMKRMGIDRQIVSLNPRTVTYIFTAEGSREIVTSINDAMSALVRKYPDQYSCMATVPLQDPPAAADELERAKKVGHIGVMITSNVAGKNLNDRSLDVFWAKVSELNMPVYIHPQNVCGGKDRLKEFHLGNLIGNPLDTTIAAASLIFGGVLDRYPNLRFYLSHMGGYVPWIRGRWQHGYSVREEPKVNGAKDPEKYFKKFYYDTIIHNADCLEFAVKTLGIDRIVYGTDYPADMGNHERARKIPGLSRLSEKDQEKILFRNAKKLYGV